jgi:hypothetical protein
MKNKIIVAGDIHWPKTITICTAKQYLRYITVYGTRTSRIFLILLLDFLTYS